MSTDVSKTNPRHKRLERFPATTRNVLSLAQKEAERLKHGYIGPEHILVALAKEKDGIAHIILLEVGLDEDRLIALLEQLTAHYPYVEMTTELSSTTKKLLERAVDEARRQGTFFIDTHHLLLGVLRSNDTIAIEMIKNGGLDQDKLCKYIRKRVKAEPTDELR
ncbi:MAG: ATP-dependent Clp protease ATP-binding subunit [Chloroflexi bacterium]|nr:ATP-dependent Clp protease ATP-binding subunit [Chloroflexota bacterium]